MGEIRNQLKSQSIQAVDPNAFETVGGRVFPDEPSIEDQQALAQIVATWQAAHAPTYGQPIGQSSQTVSAAGLSGETPVQVLTATKSQVWRVQSIAMSNSGGGAPVVAKITIGNCPIVMDFTANPNESAPFSMTNTLFVDLNSPLIFTVLSGTATDAALIVNALKVSQ